MLESADFRSRKIALNHGGGRMPALGFGTLIPDAAVTTRATGDALKAGYRHFDCAERYRNEREVGEALRRGLAAEGIAREDIFVTTKLWNSNHRPERVGPAFEASLGRLGLDYLDLYQIRSSCGSPRELERRRRRCCLPGRSSEVGLYSLAPGV